MQSNTAKPMSDQDLMLFGILDHGFGRDDAPSQAAEWIIEQLDDESKQLTGDPLPPFVRAIFATGLNQLAEDDRSDLAEAINFGVDLLRSRVERLNRLAWPSGLVRRGLWVPWSIEYRYERIYTTELQWVISAVMQHAFLGNPIAGERRPWKNRRPKNPQLTPPF